MRTAPLLLAGALAACNEPDPVTLRVLGPEIAVAPESIDFGDRAVPLTHEGTFFVSNGGKAALELTATVTGEGAAAYTLPVASATVEPNATLPMILRFEPATFLDYPATLVLTSNDEDDPEIEVAISGRGVAAPLPDIQLSALSLDFGEVEGPAVQILTLTNVGSAPLTLGDITSSGSGAFTLTTNPRGNTLAPGDDVPIVVTYDPETTDGDSGAIQIPSDDPDEDPVTVILLGNGGADYEYPEARIDCPGITNPPGFVRLDGSASNDPEGHLPLTYTWTLLAVPTDTGSGTAISSGYLTNQIGDYTDLFTDAVGAYAVALVVQNALGVRSAPALCEVHAIPAEDVLVELTWSTSNADLDLHVAQAGNALFARPGDANWCNTNPGWGIAGRGDDPSLNLDDRAGHGPENIAIPTPAEGMYDVRVHYFEDQGDDVVQATVRVYILGELAPGFPQSRNLRRNEVWDVARVNWPAATVALLSAATYEADERQCFTP
jgi:hypothetical protein